MELSCVPGSEISHPGYLLPSSCLDHVGCFLEGGQYPMLWDIDYGHGDHLLALEFVLRKILVLGVADG